MSEKVYVDPELGPVRLVRRARTRRISLRIRRDGVVVLSYPWFERESVAMAFFQSRRAWLKKVLARQAAAAEALAAERADFDPEALRKEAKACLPGRLRYWAERYGFTYGKVFIKHNVSNWGSCSAKGNINLNLNLMRLEEPLRDYVLLHELCHLRHANHGPQFHALLDSLCRDGLGRPEKELAKAVKARRIF